MSWRQKLGGYVWRLKKEHPERFGQRCKIAGYNGSSLLIMVEFEDGVQVRAARSAVRRVDPIAS